MRVLTCTLLSLVLGLAACENESRRRARPNVLLFISDDHGHRDYGFAGHDFVETPNVDRLAREGITFTNGYAAASLCLPALRSLISGVPPQVWDRMREDVVERYGQLPLAAESQYLDVMLPRMLQTGGYASFAGGKMWEGTCTQAGFDAGAIGDEIPCVLSATTFGRESLASLFAWLDDQTGPWFAWVAPKLPHSPYDAPDELIARYADVPISLEAKRYYANVTRMDRRLGEVLDYLAANGQLEDTVVVYLADNGWEQRLHGVTPHANQLGDERGKASLYDQSFRTPIIVRWPVEIGGARSSDALVTFEDVYATILDYGDVGLHPCAAGMSFREPAKRDDAPWSREEVFVKMVGLRHPDHKSTRPSRETGLFLRTGRWAYSKYVDRERELLFDVSADPDSDHDLAGSETAVLADLRDRAERNAEELAARRCTTALRATGSPRDTIPPS